MQLALGPGTLYLAARKQFRLFRGGRFHIKRTTGDKVFLLDALNYVDRQIDAYGLYEREQINYLSKQIAARHSQIFLDVGANTGLYTVMLAEQLEHVHAFEPDKRNLYQLYANLFMNSLSERVNVHPIALSTISGEIGFAPYADENRGRSGVHEEGPARVQCEMLDKLFDFAGQRVVIKIDVEGHEMAVVEGGRRLLTDNDCLLQIESFPASLPALAEVLSGLGYARFHSIVNDHYFAPLGVDQTVGAPGGQ